MTTRRLPTLIAAGLLALGATAALAIGVGHLQPHHLAADMGLGGPAAVDADLGAAVLREPGAGRILADLGKSRGDMGGGGEAGKRERGEKRAGRGHGQISVVAGSSALE